MNHKNYHSQLSQNICHDMNNTQATPQGMFCYQAIHTVDSERPNITTALMVLEEASPGKRH